MNKQSARTPARHPATVDQPILEFSGACIPLEPDGGPSPPIDMLLSAGSLALVEAGDVQQASALADAAVGLTPPAAGHVRFLGRTGRRSHPCMRRRCAGGSATSSPPATGSTG
jgi:hypothetical protein